MLRYLMWIPFVRYSAVKICLSKKAIRKQNCRAVSAALHLSVFYLTAFASSPPIVSAALVCASVVTWVYVSSVKPAE